MDTKKRKMAGAYGNCFDIYYFRIRSDRSIISACMGGKYFFQTRK